MLHVCSHVTHTSKHEHEGGGVVRGGDRSEDGGKDVSGYPEEVCDSMSFPIEEIRTGIGLPLLKVL